MNMKRNLVTQEELDTLAQIDRDCIRMHVCPPPKTFVDMEVRNANGELVDGLTMKSNSWLRGAYNLLAFQFMNLRMNVTDGVATGYSAGSMNMKDTYANTRNNATIIGMSDNDSILGGLGNAEKGIVVGTGDNAETLNGFQLSAKILHGAEVNKLSYAAQSTPVFSYASATKKWTSTITRIFNNNSGASITVKEVGIYSAASGGGVNVGFMLSRDLLTVENYKTVPNGGQLTVTYTIEMTFPG